MSQIILTFQVDQKTKQFAKKKSVKLGVSLSEYLRNLLEQDLGLGKNNNPWIELAQNIQDSLSKQEIDEMFRQIKENRKNRSQTSWEKLAA